RVDFFSAEIAGDLADRNQHRWPAGDPEVSVRTFGQLAESAEDVLVAGLLHCLIESLAAFLGDFCMQLSRDFVDPQSGVPDVQLTHRGEVMDRLAIAARSREQAASALLRREFAVAATDLEARDQAFQIPLEGPWEGLVEVVDVEDKAPVWRLEGAEVGK